MRFSLFNSMDTKNPPTVFVLSFLSLPPPPLPLFPLISFTVNVFWKLVIIFSSPISSLWENQRCPRQWEEPQMLRVERRYSGTISLWDLKCVWFKWRNPGGIYLYTITDPCLFTRRTKSMKRAAIRPPYCFCSFSKIQSSIKLFEGFQALDPQKHNCIHQIQNQKWTLSPWTSVKVKCWTVKMSSCFKDDEFIGLSGPPTNSPSGGHILANL